MWILTIRSPLNEPREFVLKRGITTLGRHSENDIAINDESASRRHAEFEYNNKYLILRDMESTNGTFVNRKRLEEPQDLKESDQIRIGFHVVSLKYQKPKETIPLKKITAQMNTRPLTRDLLLESVDQNAILLHEVSNRLTSVLDLDLALQEISNFLKVALGAEKCEVILADKFDQIGELGFSKAIANQALQQRSVVVLPDTYHIESISDSAHQHIIRTALCVPVISSHEVIALVYVYKTNSNARPFDHNDVQLAVAISHQAALAIQRSQLLEKARILEELALTDSLTGLHNRRHILKLANDEFERSKRFEHPLAMMMSDIDDFKYVNDSYGHMVGDQVLIEVANRLRNHLRSIDLLGRFGGDEFVILLVEANLEATQGISQRLHQSVSNRPIKTDRGDLFVTLSMGIAALNPRHKTAQDLLQSADDALYIAKSSGKNQIEINSS
jgi:diguanylate cyclase (GGDEF)-like protein